VGKYALAREAAGKERAAEPYRRLYVTYNVAVYLATFAPAITNDDCQTERDTIKGTCEHIHHATSLYPLLIQLYPRDAPETHTNRSIDSYAHLTSHA